jgi:hypothetical protein
VGGSEGVNLSRSSADISGKVDRGGWPSGHSLGPVGEQRVPRRRWRYAMEDVYEMDMGGN